MQARKFVQSSLATVAINTAPLFFLLVNLAFTSQCVGAEISTLLAWLELRQLLRVTGGFKVYAESEHILCLCLFLLCADEINLRVILA